MKDDILQQLREQIRVYRKAANITLAELGRRVNKSKTTVWKYEEGVIGLDVKTLFEIAEALNISVPHLFDALSAGAAASPGPVRMEDAARTYYLYYYDGNERAVCRCLIRASVLRHEASMFYHVDAFKRIDDCRDFYVGQIAITEPYMSFMFRNVNNDFEHLFIIVKEPFRKQGVMKGLLTGISYKVFQPLSAKVVISGSELVEDDTLFTWLKFSKAELSELRKRNALVLSEEYTRFNFKP
jgi:transcriptional regulator with XRE-family HTH domain